MISTARSHPLVRVALALTAAFFSLCWTTAAPAQRGAVTAARNLAQLVDESGVIVRGRVISTRVEPLPQYPALWTVVVTLQVDEALKGQTAATYAFRQYIWDPRDRADAAGYQKGGAMLLLLLKPNAEGLSSPAGLEQGRFALRSDGAGKLFAANGRNNVGLLRDVAANAAAKGLRLSPRSASLVAVPGTGPLAVDDLGGLIRELAGTN